MADPTYASTVAQMSSLITTWQTFIDQWRQFSNGAADGGPNGDGYYPLTDPHGVTVSLPCPQRMRVEANSYKVVNLTGSNNLSLTAAHAGSFVNVFNVSSTINLTIPAGLPVGWNCIVCQYGNGPILFKAATGVTIYQDQSLTRTRGNRSLVTLVCNKYNEIVISGSMS